MIRETVAELAYFALIVLLVLVLILTLPLFLAAKAIIWAIDCLGG